MIVKSGINNNRVLLSLLILTGLASSLYSQDENIGGIINTYYRVNAIGSAPRDNVTVNDATGIIAGDKVLMIQMKGAIILPFNSNQYGTSSGYVGTPGMSEILVIQAVAGNVVTFNRDILNNYNTDGSVQLIKVPFYNNSPTVTSTLTCQPWDSTSKTGGVLALIVGNTLSLGADINVAGKGFTGGVPTPVGDSCIQLKPSLDKFSYPESYTKSGYKGEGVATRADLNPQYPALFPEYAKGKGSNFSGGGGSGKFSGGGGGSGWGEGGRGGLESGLVCTPDRFSGGIGGLPILDSDVDFYFTGNFFLGAGGGSSTYGPGNTTSTPGAKGGGIVVIICETLKGNGRLITADGGSPNSLPIVSGDAGAGGGGGGGSVALYLQSYSGTPLSISARGGNGGNTSNAFGQGGGGGGGLILTNNTVKPATVSATLTGGAGGNNLTSIKGNPGVLQNDYTPKLNGFLINSIWSEANGGQVDTVCSDVFFGQISGTTPFGGTAPYTFLWEYSTTSESAGFAAAPGVNNSQNYTPPAKLTVTTWFRRTVTDNGTLVITDISKPVKVIVHPYIKNNEIGNPDTLCYAQNPATLIATNTLQDGTGIYSYKWEVSTDNINFSNPLNSNNGPTYAPEPALKLTSWYRRTVTSGSCIDSSAIVRINVLDTISNNSILSAPPDICYGSTFVNITATTPPALSGGDLTYRISWETSLNGSSGWGPAAGAILPGGFNPDELSPSYPGSLYYRRVVKSGNHDVCVNNSSPVRLNDWPVITNNAVKSISKNVPICAGIQPSGLIDSLILAGGNGIYSYLWEQSTDNGATWSAASGVNNDPSGNYNPPALTSATDFRRTVNSSACSNISNTIRIIVHAVITNNIISLKSNSLDTIICFGQNPNGFKGSLPGGGTGIPGDYAYEWQFSPDNSNYNPVPTASTGQIFDPPALNVTTFYKRKVISGACNDLSSDRIRVTVLPLIGNNILAAPPVSCKGYPPALLTGNIPTGGDGAYKYFWEQSSDNGASWGPASGVNNDPSGNYQPPALSIDMTYKRNVTSGAINNCCSDVSVSIKVTMHTLPSSTGYAGPDTTFNSPDGYYIMQASPILSHETGLWTTSGDGKIITPADNYTEVEIKSFSSPNIFLWTVTNGPCINKDSVRITGFAVEIPNGFSPNDDGMNDVFEVKGVDIYNQTVELSIVNSAGTEVFHTTNKNSQGWTNWDGKNSSGVDLPEGTYYYILMIDPEKTDMGPSKESGFIVLKRR